MSETLLDSSIPTHLRCPRTRTRRVSDTWVPATPMYSARGDQSIEHLVMAYFGVKSKGDETKGRACAAFQHSHLSIFVTFTRLAKKFKELTLYHEVSVFDASNQYFEYINCHPRTGVLRGVGAGQTTDAASGMEAVRA